jgi:hypothetical protein
MASWRRIPERAGGEHDGHLADRGGTRVEEDDGARDGLAHHAVEALVV